MKEFLVRLPSGRKVYRYDRPFHRIAASSGEQFQKVLQQLRASQTHRFLETLPPFLYNWIYLDATPALARSRIAVLTRLWKQSGLFFPNVKTREQAVQKNRQVGGKILRLSTTVPGAIVVSEGDHHDLYMIENNRVAVDGRGRAFNLSELVPDAFGDETDCPICLDPVRVGQTQGKTPVTLACSHVLHMGCIQQLQAHDRQRGKMTICPQCRARSGKTTAIGSEGLTRYVRRRAPDRPKTEDQKSTG